MKEKSAKEIETLLAQCGMVSRRQYYTHNQIRGLVANTIHNMPEEQKEALLNTIKFLLRNYNGGE